MIRLETAVEHARAIRRQMLRAHGCIGWDLTGECALASLRLAARLRSVETLRVAYVNTFECEGHAWNVVDGTIIDITSSQFTAKRGVYVGEPLKHHRGVRRYRGLAALATLRGWWGCHSNEVARLFKQLESKRRA